MIAFNDHLNSAFWATKSNANTVTTFLSPDQGFLAQFISSQPFYFSGPSLPKARHYFNQFNVSYSLPAVVICTDIVSKDLPRDVGLMIDIATEGSDANLLRAAAADGAN